MSELALSVACQGYDRVRALFDGRVRIEGCRANFLPLGPEEAFFRAFRHGEFDVSELSFSSYLMTLDRGDPEYVALPVFPSRMFRHSAIYVRSDRGITAPKDLKGRTVGVPEYQVTAAVWVRGMLQDEYGVQPSELRWRSGGLEEPGREEKLPLALPASIELQPIPAGKTLSRMLEEGEIDALVAPRAPSCFARGAAGVARLFPDFRAVEQAYFAKTGLFPIMHVIGIRRRLCDAHPWLAASVAKAFAEAKAFALRELSDVTALAASLPWLPAEVEDTRRRMGADWWPYGVDANRRTLETLT
ncbi:MAG TPA: PhnD/SsuA/transferrin family substrate-binding protein, partial [Myxococcota bacterium]|nr:PhnD/SsuA/transferrin family substrate-binding protein [Myxococcota bacterium]